MKTISDIVRFLEKSQYLKQISNENTGRLAVKLLNNGKLYCDQLINQWKLSEIGVPADFVNDLYENDIFLTKSRLSFIKTQHFYQKIQHLRTTNSTSLPVAFKSIYRTNLFPSSTPNDDIVQFPDSKSKAKLVWDVIFHTESALEKFYNLQRIRKIWWMRISSNPSRYLLEPYNLKDDLAENYPSSSQSITIKSALPHGAIDVEQISMIFPGDLQLSDEYRIKENHTGNMIYPAIIRSVIDLNSAATALLLDASDHCRSTSLLLNRKLAPYQCTVACFHKGVELYDLKELCKHLTIELQNTDLRVYKNKQIFTDNQVDLKSNFKQMDSIGLPYILIVEEDSLTTGLLKLRNRDTTLEEVIHISDIPQYLNAIFSS